MRPSAQRVQVTARQRHLLARLVRAATTPQRLVERAQIVLGAADGHSNEQLVRRLGLTLPMLRKSWEASTLTVRFAGGAAWTWRCNAMAGARTGGARRDQHPFPLGPRRRSVR